MDWLYRREGEAEESKAGSAVPHHFRERIRKLVASG